MSSLKFPKIEGELVTVRRRWTATSMSWDFKVIELPLKSSSNTQMQRFGRETLDQALNLISCNDQIHFKRYAAADQGPGRHVSDLQDLRPTADELLAAARWTRLQDPCEGFRLVLAELFNHLGHADLADRL